MVYAIEFPSVRRARGSVIVGIQVALLSIECKYLVFIAIKNPIAIDNVHKALCSHHTCMFGERINF